MIDNEYFSTADNLITTFLKKQSCTITQIAGIIDIINGMKLQGKISDEEASFLIRKLPSNNGEKEDIECNPLSVLSETGFDIDDEMSSIPKQYLDNNRINESPPIIMSDQTESGFNTDDDFTEPQFYREGKIEECDSVMSEKTKQGFSSETDEELSDVRFYDKNSKEKYESVLEQTKRESGFSDEGELSDSRFYNKEPPPVRKAQKDEKLSGFLVDDSTENDRY